MAIMYVVIEVYVLQYNESDVNSKVCVDGVTTVSTANEKSFDKQDSTRDKAK